MDPNTCYMEMFYAMRDGDHETGRERALALRDWFARGGFCPYQLDRDSSHAYIANVLRRTAHLEFA